VSLVDFATAGAAFGVAYTRTQNLTVPTLAHGAYNAILALVLYSWLA
jgi:membrane protease YdiL (CAAX protease family)